MSATLISSTSRGNGRLLHAHPSDVAVRQHVNARNAAPHSAADRGRPNRGRLMT
jgi:hypothetical protein